MSIVADFRMMDVSKLPRLEKAARLKRNFLGGIKDRYFSYLDRNSTKLKGRQESGHIYVPLLCYLKEKGIDLIKSDFGELTAVVGKVRNLICLILTSDHKNKYSDTLDPSNFDIYELGLYYNDFNDSEENDMGNAMLGGIEALHESLKLVNENTVIVFNIYDGAGRRHFRYNVISWLQSVL